MCNLVVTLSVHLDVETRSACNLKFAGVYRYVEDPTTDMWGLRYKWEVPPGTVDFDLLGQKEWRPGITGGNTPVPQRLLDHIASGGRVVAHNAVFEREVWNKLVVDKYNPTWPKMTIVQQDCTMSRCAAIAHPQGLGMAAKALNLDVDKDQDGYKLMMKMAKPRRKNADGTITWWDDPADIDRLMDYCGVDVEVEEQVDKTVPPLTQYERAVWELDQLINERGILFDIDVVERVERFVSYVKKRNDAYLRNMSGRKIKKCNADADIKAWLEGRYITAPSIAKDHIKEVRMMCELMNDDKALEVLDLRSEAWKTSTAKYGAILKCMSADRRIRGTLNYHGASPGRWAGRLVQPHNFPRVDPDDQVLQVKVKFVREVMSDTALTMPQQYALLSFIHDPLKLLALLSKCIRSMLMAGKGKKFVSGDFSNIEGRVNSWMAGETWKLDAFRAYDAGTGPDLYKLAYARSFGVDISTVGKGRKRQIGKVQELALGFQGGVGAYMSMGGNYGVQPTDLSGPVYEATDAMTWDLTAGRYESARDKNDLFEKEWVALTILKDNWRRANPAVVQSWWDYQDAAIAAVNAPGHTIRAGNTPIQYYSDQRFLWAILPSGRLLAYAEPCIKWTKRTFRNKTTGEAYDKNVPTLRFKGRDSVRGSWCEQGLYGGLLCENNVQATARDCMAAAMFNVETAGYPIVLHVHDELLTEVDDFRTDLNAKHFSQIMSALPAWADGLPVSVGAWEDKRYVK